jgi:HAD superfamily hydrolase (TIGR01509 family)
MRRPRVILSDLDDTLFDHAHATRSALSRLTEVEPALGTWPLDELWERHGVILEALHQEVLAGTTTVDVARIERFCRLLEAAGVADAAPRAADLAAVYRDAYSEAWQPVSGAIELLTAIRAEAMALVVVTNNGVVEQQLKIERCGMAPFVDALVTSEAVGVPKPGRAMFDEGLARVGAGPGEAVMLGDAWASDIEGARRAGIRAVWFNRWQMPSPDPAVPEVRRLDPADAVIEVLTDRVAR